MGNWWEAGEVVKEQPSDKWWEVGALVNEAPSEIPRRLPPISLAGDRATGFRQQVEATGMTPQQRQEAVAAMIPAAASVAAGPIVGGAVRGLGTALPFLRSAAGPLATAIESGGFRTGLGATGNIAERAGLRVAGGGISGALSELPYGTEDVGRGAALGILMPQAAKMFVEPFRRGAGPALEKAKEIGQEAYKKINEATAKIKPTALNALAEKLKATANSLNFVPESDLGVQRALDAVTNMAARNEPISVSKLEKLRRVIGRKAASRSGDEGRIGNALIKDFDAFVDSILPGTIVKDLETARDLWTKMSRSAAVESVIKRVDKAARAGQEKSAAFKKEFDRLRESKLFKQFAPEEKDVINKLAEGNLSVNALEGYGQLFAPPRIKEFRQAKGLAPLATYGGAGTLLGLPATVALGTTGYGSRALANQLAAAQAARLAMQTRTGAPIRRMAPEIFPQFGPLVIDITQGQEAYE